MAAANPVAAADVRKWTDAEGRVHYGDRPPPGMATKQVQTPGAGTTAPSREVQVEESVIRSFTVSGTSVQDLVASMRLTAPVSDVSGGRVWGRCEWRLNWEFKYAQENGKCRIDTFSIKVSSVIDFPKWVDRSAAPAALQTRWDQFARALRIHEDGHKENGVRAANDLANRLRALPPANSCEVLQQQIKDLGTRIISEYKYADKAYDRATDHGVTQGARL